MLSAWLQSASSRTAGGKGTHLGHHRVAVLPQAAVRRQRARQQLGQQPQQHRLHLAFALPQHGARQPRGGGALVQGRRHQARQQRLHLGFGDGVLLEHAAQDLEGLAAALRRANMPELCGVALAQTRAGHMGAQAAQRSPHGKHPTLLQETPGQEGWPPPRLCTAPRPRCWHPCREGRARNAPQGCAGIDAFPSLEPRRGMRANAAPRPQRRSW